MHAEEYTYRLAWSSDEESWTGLVLEFPSLLYFSPTKPGAREGIRLLVAEELEDMRVAGEQPPTPLSRQEQIDAAMAAVKSRYGDVLKRLADN